MEALDQHEVWLSVPDHEGYEVSDQGRVRSWLLPGPTERLREEPKILTASPSRTKNNKYKRVFLGHTANDNIHRLVLAAFVGPCPEGQTSCHINGDKTDNRLINLCWSRKGDNPNYYGRYNGSNNGRKAV